jgi:hypothetical protein
MQPVDERSYTPIFEVTRGLRALLHSQLLSIMPNAVVTLRPPGGELSSGPGLNLYLYRVVESPAGRNQAWRGDRQHPAGTTPSLALVLSYLLTPLGPAPLDETPDGGDDAHKYLGVAMMTLHENPVLTRTHLPGFDADSVLPSYFRDSFETVGVVLQQLSLDELSKIAAPLSHPYRLSVAYEVSLVELTPTRAAAVRGGIVLTPATTVFTLERPTLASIAPPSGALAHAGTSNEIIPNRIVVRGSALGTPVATSSALVGGSTATVTSSSATEVTVVLPSSVAAGPSVDVQIVVDGSRSLPLPYTIDPWVTTSVPVRTALDPMLPADLEVVVQGAGFTAGAEVRFEGSAGVQTAAATGDANQLKATIPALPNGIHEVRVLLTDSSLSNPRTLEVIPRIDTVTATLTGAVHTLTLAGVRFTGTDVRLRLDGSERALGRNDASAVQLVAQLGRALAAGPHTVSLQIDGSQSRTAGFDVSA